MFRALWSRYWCRLHVLSARREALLPLCRLLEMLVQEHHPALCLHLCRLGLHPTAVAWRWIQFAFAGTLPVEQVLMVWDRVIGFDSLELLPLLAVAIFLFRSHTLLAATSAEEAERMLANCSELRVVPLLQAFLYSPPSLIASTPVPK